MRLWFLSLLATSLAAQAPAPPDTTEQDLLALLNTPVTVASTKGASLRTSPSVISVITQEEIEAIGPRNINDILSLVPGFQIAYDTQGSTGLMARSMWAYEGKCLVLWNNIDMTDLLYGITTLGDRFPIDQIKRIEIIRGPGSAIYGGDAELVVIKIISKDSDDVKPFAASAGYRRAQGFIGKEAGAMAAEEIGGYRLTAGAQNIKSQSLDSTTFGYLNLTSDRLTLNVQAENMTKGDPEYPTLTSTTETQWLSQNAVLKYKVLNEDGLALTPYVKYTKSIPWIDTIDGGLYARRQDARPQAGFDADCTWGKWGLGLGYNYYEDRASVSSLDTDGSVLNSTTGATTFTQTDNSAYLEVSYNGYVNVTVGGRYDNNSVSGSKFVPRLAVTKAWANLYAKALYSEAFRTPDVLDLGYPNTPDLVIKPETARVYEVEVGGQFGSHFLSGNVYYEELNSPLVYMTSGYQNGPTAKSTGLELTYKYKAQWGFANLAYSHSIPDSQVPQWTVNGDSHTAVGAAKDQVTGLVSVKLNSVATANANAVYLSRRQSYDSNNNLLSNPAEVLLNGNLTFKVRKTALMLGAYDIFDKKQPILPGYEGSGTDGLPTYGLEGFVKVKYGF